MSLAIKTARYSSMGGMAGRVRQGDPGIWGAIKGAVKGFVTGGPIGAVTGGISGLTDSGPRKVSSQGPQLFATGPGLQQPVPTPGLQGFAQRAIPGGESGYTCPSAAGGCPSGYRLNKTGYFRKKDGIWVEPKTRCVKIRRRNSMNPRALSRAISRVNGGKAIQAKLAQITTGQYTAGGKKK